MNKKYLVIVDPYIPRNIFNVLKKTDLQLIAVYTSFQADEFLTSRRIHDNEFVLTQNEQIAAYADILAKLKSFNIISVVIGFDTGVHMALQLAHDLKLPNFIPIEDSEFLGNKYLTGKFLQARGLFSAKQIELTQKNKHMAIEKAVEQIGFPLIIKPQNSAGSYGITFCYSKEDLIKAANLLLGSKDFLGNILSQIVIQERLEGNEYAVCTLSTQLKHKIIAVLRYRQDMLGNQNMIRSLEIVDSEERQYQSVINYVKAILDATHYQSGLAASEVMLTKNGPCLIELNPRAAGLIVEDLLIKCTGISQGDLLALCHTNQALFIKNIDAPIKRIAYGEIVFIHNSRQNNIFSQAAMDAIVALPSCKQTNFSKKVNDTLAVTTDIFTSLGPCLLCNEDADQFKADLAKLMAIEKEFF